MKILLKLRESSGLNQDAFAKIIGVSSKQLESWESGDESIPIKHLKDIAFYFNCSVNDLINNNESKISTNSHFMHVDSDIEDGFWGHIGILLHGHKKTKWYPITQETQRRVSSLLINIEMDNEWLSIVTLNNRMLLFNPASVNRVWLLDDAADQPSDWSIPLDGYIGQPAEFYNILDDYKDNNDVSEKLIKYCEDFTDIYDMGEDEIYTFLYYTNIYDIKGIETSYWVQESNLANLVFDVDIDAAPIMFNLSSEEFDSYFSSKSLSLIDMPRRSIELEQDRLLNQARLEEDV